MSLHRIVAVLLALAAGGLTGIIAAYELNYSRAATEVAALAIFLDRLLRGKALEREFNGRLKIRPSARGKRVIESDQSGHNL